MYRARMLCIRAINARNRIRYLSAPSRLGFHVYFLLAQVSCLSYLALWILHHHCYWTTNMANRKAPEVVTNNKEYTDGYLAAAIGLSWRDNPYTSDSWEWLSWDAGWHKGRQFYLDEGWSVSW